MFKFNNNTLLKRHITLCLLTLFFTTQSLISNSVQPTTNQNQKHLGNEIQECIVQEIGTILLNRALISEQCEALGSDYLQKAFTQIDRAQLSPNNSSALDSLTRKTLVQLGSIIAQFHGNMSPTCNLILLTKRNAPTFYGIVEQLSSKLEIPAPMIFMSDDENFINALGISFSHEYSMVVIGKQLLVSFPPDELISVIAHELGHIKKHHMVKRTLAFASLAGVLYFTGKFAVELSGLDLNDPNHPYRNKIIKSLIGSASITATHKLLESYFQAQETEADGVELSLTKNPTALANSLKHMDDLCDEQRLKRQLAAVDLNAYIEAQFGHMQSTANEVKKNVWGDSIFSKAYQNYNTVMNVKYHPDDEVRPSAPEVTN